MALVATSVALATAKSVPYLRLQRPAFYSTWSSWFIIINLPPGQWYSHPPDRCGHRPRWNEWNKAKGEPVTLPTFRGCFSFSFGSPLVRWLSWAIDSKLSLCDRWPAINVFSLYLFAAFICTAFRKSFSTCKIFTFKLASLLACYFYALSLDMWPR